MNQKKFLQIISKCLNVKINKISLKTKSDDLEEWDSIAQLTILSALDKATKGKASRIKGLGNHQSLKKIWEILKNKGLTK